MFWIVFNYILHTGTAKIANTVKQNQRVIFLFTHYAKLLMPEMPHTGDNHCKVVLHAIINTVFVTHRTTRLNKCFYTRNMCQLHAIIERKECIACQYCSF